MGQAVAVGSAGQAVECAVVVAACDRVVAACDRAVAACDVDAERGFTSAVVVNTLFELHPICWSLGTNFPFSDCFPFSDWRSILSLTPLALLLLLLLWCTRATTHVIVLRCTRAATHVIVLWCTRAATHVIVLWCTRASAQLWCTCAYTHVIVLSLSCRVK